MADHPLDCLLWGGKPGANGYGYKRRGGATYLAHRLVWSDAHGEIPPGYVIHHVCEVRLCVRLEHLACMTRADHTRLHGKPKVAACKWGHDLTAEGARRPDGSCRSCSNRRTRENYHRGGKAKRDARLGITARS